ncbi:hypothetical protein GTS_37110 [Gandjariella thermophila]|uniref:Uncharacterized protein n=1 Tax=Gandjariella thermophila TaxID=1931992 RepID=A0A4D4JBN6_9PSEU|nr:hypothetical protein GTS_37110 [Gandjariella thermophila]
MCAGCAPFSPRNRASSDHVNPHATVRPPSNAAADDIVSAPPVEGNTPNGRKGKEKCVSRNTVGVGNAFLVPAFFAEECNGVAAEIRHRVCGAGSAGAASRQLARRSSANRYPVWR